MGNTAALPPLMEPGVRKHLCTSSICPFAELKNPFRLIFLYFKLDQPQSTIMLYLLKLRGSLFLTGLTDIMLILMVNLFLPYSKFPLFCVAKLQVLCYILLSQLKILISLLNGTAKAFVIFVSEY